jgi:hypothetical protein
MGRSGDWSGKYIGLLLRDRRAVGEYQPRRKRDRRPDGPAIPGYFPKAVNEAQWLAAWEKTQERYRVQGRVMKKLNVFARLLYNAADGSTFFGRRVV